MGNNASGTYLERLQARFKNNPLIAWGIIAATLVIALATLIPATREILKDLRISAELPPPLHITLQPLEPRFLWQSPNKNGPPSRILLSMLTDGEAVMNWGGGSQAVFFETRAGEPLTPYTPQRTPEDYPTWRPVLETAMLDGKVVQIWEIINGNFFGRPQFYVNITYDAPAGAPLCVIKQWGIIANLISAPPHGLAIEYSGGGGADVFRTRGAVKIEADRKLNPILYWMAGSEEGADPNEIVSYLAPGEPRFFLLEALYDYRVDMLSGEPRQPERQAFELKAYALVLVAGKEHFIESLDAVYAVAIDNTEQSDIYDTGDLIETARLLAFFPRGATTREQLAQVVADSRHRSYKHSDQPSPDATNGVATAEPMMVNKSGGMPSSVGSPSQLGTGRLEVQIAAFNDHQHATELAHKVNDKGFATVVTEAVVPSGVVYRVRLAGTFTPEDALLQRERLKSAMPELKPITVPSTR